ncbi:hypothetical protein ACWGA0_23405 [Streptomyces erythrochromogenes]
MAHGPDGFARKTATDDRVHGSATGAANSAGVRQDRGAVRDRRVSHAAAVAANEATGALAS